MKPLIRVVDQKRLIGFICSAFVAVGGSSDQALAQQNEVNPDLFSVAREQSSTIATDIEKAAAGDIQATIRMYRLYDTGTQDRLFKIYRNRILAGRYIEMAAAQGGVSEKEVLLSYLGDPKPKHSLPMHEASVRYIDLLAELVKAGSSTAIWKLVGHYGSPFGDILATLLPESKVNIAGRWAYDEQRSKSAALISVASVLKQSPSGNDFSPAANRIRVSSQTLERLGAALLSFKDNIDHDPQAVYSLISDLDREGFYELSMLIASVAKLFPEIKLPREIELEVDRTKIDFSAYNRSENIVAYAGTCLEKSSSECIFGFLAYMMPLGPVALVPISAAEAQPNKLYFEEELYIGRDAAIEQFKSGSCVGGFSELKLLEEYFLAVTDGLERVGFEPEIGTLEGCIAPSEAFENLVFVKFFRGQLIGYLSGDYAVTFPGSELTEELSPSLIEVHDLSTGVTYCARNAEYKEVGSSIMFVPSQVRCGR